MVCNKCDICQSTDELKLCDNCNEYKQCCYEHWSMHRLKCVLKTNAMLDEQIVTKKRAIKTLTRLDNYQRLKNVEAF